MANKDSGYVCAHHVWLNPHLRGCILQDELDKNTWEEPTVKPVFGGLLRISLTAAKPGMKKLVSERKCNFSHEAHVSSLFQPCDLKSLV